MSPRRVERERVLVDGMNVIGSRPDGWWRDRPGAIRRLLARLQGHARNAGADLTLVLDGRPLDDLGEGTYGGVRVVYARRRGRDAADARIVELVETDADPESVRVVTSDRKLAEQVRELGATTQGAAAFLAQLDRD